MIETQKIINGNCIEVMSTFPENSIDLILTSPPYNVGINYDTHIDTMSMEDYWKFTEEWLKESFRVLKSDGRVAINIPYEVNVKDRGGRIPFMAEFWYVMKQVGFKFFGLVDLKENAAHRLKTTAWGSWMSPSGPYIYNPKECVILAYKEQNIKKVKGVPQWKGEIIETEQEDGTLKNKLVYSEEDKKEFMDLVYAEWSYFPDVRQLTKATFSMDIPSRAIKILTYKNDIVLDPFSGSGTTLISAETLGRRWIGIELSENYTKLSREKVQHFIDLNKQTQINFN
jgi:site-specific DNA-methyltransferase (adenine-specific)